MPATNNPMEQASTMSNRHSVAYTVDQDSKFIKKSIEKYTYNQLHTASIGFKRTLDAPCISES